MFVLSPGLYYTCQTRFEALFVIPKAHGRTCEPTADDFRSSSWASALSINTHRSVHVDFLPSLATRLATAYKEYLHPISNIQHPRGYT